MKKRMLFVFTVITLGILAFGAIRASAATSGIYTYEVSGGTATITDCDTNASGAIVIPDELGGYPVTKIGSSAFYNCTGLTSITIPDGVTSIGDYAFHNCTGLTSITIPDSVTSIGSYAFDGCTGLTKVTIGSGVANIGYSAFCFCFGLESVYITDLAAYLNCAYEDFESNPMYYADNLYLNGKIVTQITIPDSVTSIGSCAFSGCTGLKSITIPNSVTSIGDGAFRYCTGLTSIEIPDSVTSIGDNAFYNCNRLTSVEIPDSVTSIGDNAFCHCAGLKSITIPNSVTSIGDGAFRYCTGLTQINWNAKNVADFYSDSNVFKYAGQNSAGIQVVFGDGVERIPAGAFVSCTGLTSVTIGNSVKSIGSSAFYNCTGLTRVYITDLAAYISCEYGSASSNPMYYAENLYLNGELVTKITIPDGVTSIGSYAFSNCTGLTSVEIPDSVTNIGDEAFYNCTGLTSVYITDLESYLNCEYDSGNSNPMCYADNLYINGELATEITIPEGVTQIAKYAFIGCAGLTSVEIPDSVTSIGDKAFYNCNRLTSIAIPDSVTSIGDYAFRYCTGLTSVTIGNSVKSIGSSAFRDCTGLTQINWNAKNVADFDCNSNVFADAGQDGSGIQVTFGDGVVKIPAYIFCASDSSKRPNITSATIGNSVTSIGDYAFHNCTGLTSITIPDSVTSIGDGAFNDCTGLTSIAIPDSVTNIGNYAFSRCSKLTNVYYTGSEEEWEEIYIGADNTYLTGATRHYNQRVKPVISKNNRTYTVSFANNALGNSAIGKSVIVALYDNEKFVEMVSAVYNGTALEFVTTKPHTSAKVMVWGSFADMQPACHAEVTN